MDEIWCKTIFDRETIKLITTTIQHTYQQIGVRIDTKTLTEDAPKRMNEYVYITPHQKLTIFYCWIAD